MKRKNKTVPEFNRDFVVFRNEDEWLEARKKTIGASGLAQFWATGQQPTPLPDNVPALQSALAFGSIWEPYIVQKFAANMGLTIRPVNTDFSELKAGEISWYDCSFYVCEEWGLHMSPDAIYRDKDGLLHTLEVKTSGRPKLWMIEQSMLKRYSLQAAIEARVVGADCADIVYAQRPDEWEKMDSRSIEELLREPETTPIDLNSKNDMNAIFAALERMRADAESDDSELFKEYVEAEERFNQAKAKLSEYLNENQDVQLHYGGRLAQIVESSRTSTDYKKLVEDHHIGKDELAKYQKVTSSTRLSVTQDKSRE